MKVLNWFKFLGFEDLKLYQRTDMFNFSIDTVLLAQFVTINKSVKTIVDFGTNNAIIPLLLTKRSEKSHIIGVEIQKEAVEIAEENVKLNNLQSRITIINKDIKKFAKENVYSKFDIVVCNPPFYSVKENSRITKKSDLLIPARHETLVTLEEIIKAAQIVLTSDGYFALVHRPQRLAEITCLLKKYNFEIKRLQFVHPKIERDANIVLIEARLNSTIGLIVSEPIIAHINDTGQYSSQLRKLFFLENDE